METMTTTTPATTTFAATVDFSAIPKKHLDTLLSEISRNPVLYILETVLFEFSTGYLTMTAGNLDNRIQVSTLCECHDLFSFAVTPDFLKVLAKKGTGPVQVSYSYENQDTPKGMIYKGSVSANGLTWATDDPDEYPLLPEIQISHDPRTINPAEIAELLTFTTKDETRPAMTGVNVHTELTASDGRRLVVYPMQNPGESDAPAFILRRAKLWAKLPADPVRVEIGTMAADHVNPSWALIRVNPWVTIYTRLIDAAFPDFRAFIPQDQPYHMETSRQALIDALNKVLPATNKTTRQISVHVSNSPVKVTAKDIDHNRSAESTIQAQTNAPGLFVATFNADLLLSMLKATPDGVIRIQFTTESKPFTWTSGQRTYLLMPVIIY